MISKLFSIVVSYCLDSVRQMREARNDCLIDHFGRFAGDAGQSGNPTFTLN
jgi:hypothetical protein